MTRTRLRASALALTLAVGAGGALAAAPGAAAAAPVPAAVPASAQVDTQQVAAVDAAVLVALHDSNLNEIRAGRLALERATDARIRELARMFIAHHTRLDGRTQWAAEQLGVDLPNEPSAQTRLELALLRQFRGADFDRAWLVQQLVSHARSILVTEVALALGRERPVLGLAAAAAPVIQHHYEELRELADDYGIPAPSLEDLPRAPRSGARG